MNNSTINLIHGYVSWIDRIVWNHKMHPDDATHTQWTFGTVKSQNDFSFRFVDYLLACASSLSFCVSIHGNVPVKIEQNHSIEMLLIRLVSASRDREWDIEIERDRVLMHWHFYVFTWISLEPDTKAKIETSECISFVRPIRVSEIVKLYAILRCAFIALHRTYTFDSNFCVIPRKTTTNEVNIWPNLCAVPNARIIYIFRINTKNRKFFKQSNIRDLFCSIPVRAFSHQNASHKIRFSLK